MSLARKPASTVYWLGQTLYLNITNRCSNNCYFCFRRYKDGLSGFNLTLHGEPSAERILAAIRKVRQKRRWNEIVFCGFGEPLERLDAVLAVTGHLKNHSLIPIRINTNGQGQLLTKDIDVVQALHNAGVDRISVSLNAHNHPTYKEVCKPKFDDAYHHVRSFIDSAAKRLPTEITTVTIPEVDISKIRQIATSVNAKFRIRSYEPCFW